MNLSEDNKDLSLADFISSERQEADQPGTRLMLTKDNPKTKWSEPNRKAENSFLLPASLIKEHLVFLHDNEYALQ